MGTFERVSRLIQQNVQDILSGHEDPERLLAQAVEELDWEVASSEESLRNARRDASEAQGLVTARQDEARHFQQRAVAAEAAGSTAEATEQRTFERKALESARSLEEAAARAAQKLAGLERAVEALKQTTRDARGKRDEVGARLREVRAHGGKRVEAPSPRPEPARPASEFRPSVEEEFRNLESTANVDARLDALKKKVRGGS